MKIILKLFTRNELELIYDFNYDEFGSNFDRNSKHNDIINILKNNNLNLITTDNKIIINDNISNYKLLFDLILNKKYRQVSVSFYKPITKINLLTEIRKLKNIDNVEFIKDVIDNHFDKFNDNFKINSLSLKKFILDLITSENIEEYSYLTDAKKFDLI